MQWILPEHDMFAIKQSIAIHKMNIKELAAERLLIKTSDLFSSASHRQFEPRPTWHSTILFLPTHRPPSFIELHTHT